MKATIEQATLAQKTFWKHSGNRVESMQAALQAAFDAMPKEPTPEQIERAWYAFCQHNGADRSGIEAALKAAMTEPPPRSYPWAEKVSIGHGNDWVIHVTPNYVEHMRLSDGLEFDPATMTIRAKKGEVK